LLSALVECDDVCPLKAATRGLQVSVKDIREEREASLAKLAAVVLLLGARFQPVRQEPRVDVVHTASIGMRCRRLKSYGFFGSRPAPLMAVASLAAIIGKSGTAIGTIALATALQQFLCSPYG
jgi:hypothetical protein